MDLIKIGVITTSDRASQGIYEDISGKAIIEVMGEYLLNVLGRSGRSPDRARGPTVGRRSVGDRLRQCYPLGSVSNRAGDRSARDPRCSVGDRR